jgi:choline oxidase
MHSSPDSEFDYVVVGGGTAGCITAARLAEDPAVTVALLEAGPPDQGDIRVLELKRCVEVMGSELDWDYWVEPQELGNRDVRFNRARVLGGCSSHNAAIAFKAPDYDLRIWEELGATGWGPEGCGPYFDRVWEKLHCEYGCVDNEWEQSAIEACVEAGYPRVELGRRDVDEGAGFFLLHKQGIYRTSSSISYLHSLDRLPENLALMCDTEADRLLLEGRRAVGVDTRRGPVYARREVIVACGVVNSPKLLLLSGIGPAEHLRDVGIDVVCDLPVGEHLLDHHEGVVMWESTAQVPLESAQDWECGVYAKSDPSLAVPDLLMPMGPVPYDLYTTAYGCPTCELGRGFAMAPYVLRPRSEGWVRLRSQMVEDKPLIDPRYHTDPEGHDTRVLLFGMRLARKLATMPALRDWVKRELAPGSQVRDDSAEFVEFARRTGNTTYHPVGTCRMGAVDDGRAVVGPDLRVKGIASLRVADSSIFPTHVGVNPAVTGMMIGEKAADLVRGRSAKREIAAAGTAV